jgi:methylase of polypeptide subunit release factors
LRSNLSLNGSASELYVSDLFEGIPRCYKEKFDIISFNPPYLPSENIPLDRRADLALVGGEEGYEVAKNFLRSSNEYLKVGGKVIILAYSSWKDIFDLRPIGLTFLKTNFEEKDIDGEKFIVMEFSKI